MDMETQEMRMMVDFLRRSYNEKGGQMVSDSSLTRSERILQRKEEWNELRNLNVSSINRTVVSMPSGHTDSPDKTESTLPSPVKQKTRKRSLTLPSRVKNFYLNRKTLQPIERNGPFMFPVGSIKSDLNIWSREVDWDNDANFVRIYLPITEEVGQLTLQRVTCSIIHLEMGHRLKVQYPGVNFSTLISHSAIKRTVEASIGPSKLTIRLAKIQPYYIWPYVTFLTADSCNLTFHLDAHHHLTTPKTAELMMMFNEKKFGHNLDAPEAFYGLIKRELRVDPLAILISARQRHFRTQKDDSQYQIVTQCNCDTCSGLMFPVPLGHKFNQGVKLRICDIWWQNNLDYAFICIPKPPLIPGHRVKLIQRKTHSGQAIRVTFPKTTFTALIWHHLPSKEAIKMRIKDDLIVIRVEKQPNGLWSYITAFTEEEDGLSVIYHLNPHYHLKLKKIDLWVSNKSPLQLGNVDHYVNSLTSDRLEIEEIVEVLKDMKMLHQVEEPPRHPATEKRRSKYPKSKKVQPMFYLTR